MSSGAKAAGKRNILTRHISLERKTNGIHVLTVPELTARQSS